MAQKAKQSKKFDFQNRTYLVVFLVAFAMIGSFVFGHSLAAPKDKGGGSSSGWATTCSVSPASPALGTQYTLTANNVPAGYGSYQFWVIDSQATAVDFAGPGPTPNSYVGYGWVNRTGSYTVQFKASDGKKGSTTFATCSFTVS